MKKIITLILATVMLMSVCAIQTFAAEDMIEADYNFAVSLGFVNEDEILPDTQITRIQLAEIFYNIVMPGQKFKSDYFPETYYADVAVEKKHIVDAVSGMGIMRGYADGVFAPDAPVTYNQLVKTFVSFLGYDFKAEMYGGWPGGYLAQAGYLKILPNGVYDGNAPATGAMVFDMLKRAVSVDINVLDYGSGYVKGINYLAYWRNVYVTKGSVTANYLTSITTDEYTDYFSVAIDNVKMDITDKAVGIQELLGYQLYVYYEKNGDSLKILHYELCDNNIVDIQSGDIYSVTKGEITYYENENDKVVCPLSSTLAVTYNGSYMASYTVADLNPFETKKLDGFVRLIDKDLDGIYDSALVSAYKVFVADLVKENKIFNLFNKSEYIDVTNYKERNIDIRNSYGEPVQLEQIKAGVVLNVLKDSKNNVKRIIATKDIVSGQIQEISKSGNKILEIKVNNTSFDVSPYVTLIDAGNRLGTGTAVTLYFNCDGKVSYIDADSQVSTSLKRGYVVDVGEEGGLDGKNLIMIFDEDGAMQTYKARERIRINGEYVSSSFMKNRLGTVDGTANGRVERQLILFSADEELNLSAIEIADQSGSYNKGFYKFTNYSESGLYVEPLGVFSDSFAVDTNALIFTVPSEKNRDVYEDYKLGGELISRLSVKSVTAYGSGREGIFAETLVISSENSSTTMDHKAPVFMIRKISDYVNDEGESFIKIDGPYVEGTQLRDGYFLIEKTDLMKANSNKMPEIGDVFRVPAFHTNKIVEIVWPVSTLKEGLIGANPSASNPTAQHRYAFGHVMQRVGDIVKVKRPDGTFELQNLTGRSYKIIELKRDKKGEIKHVLGTDAGCVKDEETFPGEGSDCLFYQREGTGIVIFVFN